MKKVLTPAAAMLCCVIAFSQAPAAAQTPAPPSGASAGDTWSDIPKANDDRFTNPKSKVYAGPNGWWGTGQLRASVAAAKLNYDFRASLSYNKMFSATNADKLWLMGMDFGTEKPSPGVYAVAAVPDPAKKTVQVSFGDLSGQKMRAWTSAEKSGTVAVSQVNGHLYFRFRDVRLQPNGIHNTGELKNPMTIGFEGAMPPER